MTSSDTHLDIPPADMGEFQSHSLQRRSARWDRRMFRQPSSVIVIRNEPPIADDGAAAADADAGL